MPNLTTVTLSNGIPIAGSGTVSTLDGFAGTAGTSNTNVLSVQGIASGVAQPVTVSGVTVSGSALQVYGSFSTTSQSVVSISGVGVTASSTAPTSGQAALVVAISPNSINANGRKTPANSAPIVFASQTYQSIGASSSNVALTGGGGGSTGDYLDGVLVIPSSTSPGSVSIVDLSTSTIVFAGGTTSLTALVPFFIPVGAVSANGPWKITTGASVTCLATGNFT